MISDPAVSGTHLAVCKQSMSSEHLSSSNNSLTEILRSFWETEAVGIKESSNLESSSEPVKIPCLCKKGCFLLVLCPSSSSCCRER